MARQGAVGVPALPRATGLALALLCVLCGSGAAPARAAPVRLPCEAATRVAGCSECIPSAKKCFACIEGRYPQWATEGHTKQCKPVVRGPACRAASRDPQCEVCDGPWCVRCRPGLRLDDKSGKCVKGNCAQVSRTPGCAACNRDGTCTRCANAGNGERRFVVPANALYINAPAGGGPDAVCLTLPELQAEARTFTGRALAIPPSCVEVTTDFKCARCADRATLTADNRCVYRGNRCKATLGWYQYCVKCSANGRRCLTCTPGRSPLNGECSLACKRLFGISCAACTATACTRIDPAYASGRR